MKIILSPTKKMRTLEDDLPYSSLPVHLEQTEVLLRYLKSLSEEELKALWKCSDAIVKENLERLSYMDLRKHLTPAILSYEGIAFQYMAPGVMEEGELEYLQTHLRILSGFYGSLRPFDGVVPYRLEMQAGISLPEANSLYAFWGDRLYRDCIDESHTIINLASLEYSKAITPYLKEEDRVITCRFCEKVKDKLVTKGTYAKMARGEMVRYMAQEEVTDPEALKQFQRLGYQYREDLSTSSEFIFERRMGELQ